MVVHSYFIAVNQTTQFSHGIAIRIGESIFTPMQYAVDKAIRKYSDSFGFILLHDSLIDQLMITINFHNEHSGIHC